MDSRIRHELDIVILILAAHAFVGCAILPKHIARPVSKAVSDTGETALGHLTAPIAAQHPCESGFLLLNFGNEAIQARVALAEVAEASIDAQYFEWKGDASGRVLMDRVIAAADRGVRVRLLIDDYNIRGHGIGFVALDAHPNIEVRVFNPFVRGRLRLPQLITRFSELNHRMHNKMFIVDGQAAIVGGRNITDRHFGMGRELGYRDFDLLAMGAVVPQAEAAFDLYWNSQWAYPVTALRKPVSLEELQRRRARFDADVANDRAGYPYSLPSDAAEALGWLERISGEVTWAPAEVVYDDPSLMAEPLHSQVTAVARRLIALMEQARQEIIVENAYVVPPKRLADLRATLGRGVRVRLLTNSLASTDVVLINAAYSTSRPALAELGVALYEMKPYGASRALYVARPTVSRARLTLHGKAAVFDRAIVFLGSLNLDPRSTYLDTEAVFVVHSTALATQVLAAFATDFEPANAWQIGHVVRKHKVAWITGRPELPDVEPHDPAPFWRRVKRWFGTLLPVRSIL